MSSNQPVYYEEIFAVAFDKVHRIISREFYNADGSYIEIIQADDEQRIIGQFLTDTMLSNLSISKPNIDAYDFRHDPDNLSWRYLCSLIEIASLSMFHARTLFRLRGYPIPDCLNWFCENWETTILPLRNKTPVTELPSWLMENSTLQPTN